MALAVIVLAIFIFLIYGVIDASKNKKLSDAKDNISADSKEEIFEKINNNCMQFIRMQIFHACMYCAAERDLGTEAIWSSARSIVKEIYDDGLFTEFLPLYYFGIILAASEQANFNQSSPFIMSLYEWFMSNMYNKEQAARSMESIISLKTPEIGDKPTDEMCITFSGQAEFSAFENYINIRIKVNREHKPNKDTFFEKYFPIYSATTKEEFFSLPATMLEYWVHNNSNAKESFAFYNFLLDNHKDYLINKINTCSKSSTNGNCAKDHLIQEFG